MAHDFKTQPELSNSQMQFYYWTSPFRQITESFDAKCVKVTDGDSIRVKTNFRDFDFPIRFARINAPELNAGGRESGNWLRSQILNENIRVEINPDNRTGKFGRIIGEVNHRGINMNEASLRGGFSNDFER